MTPIISVIIPVYNSEKTILLALDSILKQSFKDYEIIIVDGLSTDDTLKKVEELQENRIKIFSEKDKGVYDAMNKGIQLSHGEWIYFIGSDDYLYNEKVFETLVKHMKSTKFDVLYGNVLINGDTGWAKDRQVYNGKFTFQKLLKSNICHQSIFYRRSFIVENQIQYNLRYPISADWDFNIACRKKTDFKFIDCIIAVFNAGGISTGSKNEPFLEERKTKYADLYKKYKLTLLQRIAIKLKFVNLKF